MEIKQLHRVPRESIEQLLAAIPFYKSVKQRDPAQFETLLQHSRLVKYAPGEVVLQRGETDQWLYFLLKGQLSVFAGEDSQAQTVNTITPGEVFGDLAMLVDRKRTATVIADPNCRQVLVFGTDFKAFGTLEDTRVISLSTKLAYFANTVHSLRWKLEVYRVRYPQSELASQHRKIKLYTGPRGTIEELLALHQQARELAQLLLRWNGMFGTDALPLPEEPSRRLVAALGV